MEFTVRCGGGRAPCVGLHAPAGRAVVDVPRCLLQDDEANAILSSARRFFAENAECRRGARVELRLAIRRAAQGGETLVVLRESGAPFGGAGALARFLAERHPGLGGVVLLRAPSGRRGGARTHALFGRDRLAEEIGGFRVELPASSFAQISAAGAEELVRLVGQLALPVAGLRAIDLYGGVGLYGMELVRLGVREVVVCDADAEAIAAGRRAAAGLAALRHVHADAGRFLRGRAGGRVDLVVANPPRTGLDPGVARAIVVLAPRRLILVSCDPPTLARDLGILVREGAYRVERLVPLDLFPQTAHLETVALLTRA